MIFVVYFEFFVLNFKYLFHLFYIHGSVSLSIYLFYYGFIEIINISNFCYVSSVQNVSVDFLGWKC